MLEVSPSGFGRNESHRISALENAVNAIEREVNGMRRERIAAADGQIWEVLARYSGIIDITKMPFEIEIEKSGSQYTATVSRGFIVERITNKIQESNQVRYILPQGVTNPGSPSQPHAINPGQAVYVKYSTDNKGKVKDSPQPAIFVDADNSPSQNYYPATGDYAGQEGEYIYKLAKLEITANGVDLQLFHAGDNIHHYAERVTMESVPVTGYTDDVRRVLKTYEPEADKVIFRSLKQTTSEEGVPVILELGESETEATKETIDFARIAGRNVSSGAGPSAQIEVLKDGSYIRVQGNGKTGKRTLFDSDGNVAWEIEWIDGLVVSEGIEAYQDQCSCSNNYNFY
jgi:hypothetical protein